MTKIPPSDYSERGISVHLCLDIIKLTLINSKKSPKMLEFMAIFGDFNL